MNSKPKPKYLFCLKILTIFTIISLIIAPFPKSVSAQGGKPTIIYMFWGEDCPHCANAMTYFEELANTYPEIDLRFFEVYNSAENQELFTKMADAYNFEAWGVPTIFIGDRYWEGFGEVFYPQFESTIENCIEFGCTDAGAGIISSAESSSSNPVSSSQLEPSINWIAYIGVDNNVWLIQQDGSQTKQITDDAKSQLFYYQNIIWSPDGKKLAFNRVYIKDYKHDILFFDITQNIVKKLIDKDQTAGGFDWYLDSDHIIFDRPATPIEESGVGYSCTVGYKNNDGLFIVTLPTGEIKPFLHLPGELPIRNPKVSPDNKLIIFDFLQPYEQDLDQYILSINNPNAFKELKNVQSDCDWNPDGSMVACGTWDGIVNYPSESEYRPISLFSQSGEFQNFIPPVLKSFDDSPIWSPSGELIALRSTQESGGFADGPCGGGAQPVGNLSFIPFHVDIYSLKTNSRITVANGKIKSWSPDSNRILVSSSDNDNTYIHIINIETLESTFLVNGKEAAWQPSPESLALNPYDVQKFITEKNQIIDDLSTFPYTLFEILEIKVEGVVEGVDESAAKVLISELDASTTNIPPSQADALDRLLLQEKTILNLRNDFVILSNLYTEAEIDMYKILIGITIALRYLEGGQLNVLKHLAIKTVEDFNRLWVLELEKSSNFKNYIDVYNSGWDAYSIFSGDPADQIDFLASKEIEAEVLIPQAEVHSQYFNTWVEPTLLHFVQTARDSKTENLAQGNFQKAKLNMNYLESLSDNSLNFVKETNFHYERARLADEFLMDLSDLVTAGTGLLPALIVSAITRLTKVVIDRLAEVKILNNMTCIAEAASKAGTYAFYPDIEMDELIDCQEYFDAWLIVEKSFEADWISQEAWNSQIDNLNENIISHDFLLIETIDDAQDGKISTSKIKNISDSEMDLSYSISNLMTMLEPPNADTKSKFNVDLYMKLLELETYLVTENLSIMAINSENDEVMNDHYLKDITDNWKSQIDNLNSAIETAGDFAKGNNIPNPVIHTSPSISYNPSKREKMEIEIYNAGDGELVNGLITVKSGDGILHQIYLPSIPPFSSKDFNYSLEKNSNIQNSITIELTWNNGRIYRNIMLVNDVSYNLFGANQNNSINQPFINLGSKLFAGGLIFVGFILITGSISGIVLLRRKSKKNHT